MKKRIWIKASLPVFALGLWMVLPQPQASAAGNRSNITSTGSIIYEDGSELSAVYAEDIFLLNEKLSSVYTEVYSPDNYGDVRRWEYEIITENVLPAARSSVHFKGVDGAMKITLPEETEKSEKEEKPAPEETEKPEKEEKPAPEETEEPEKEETPAPEETEKPEKEGTPAPEETEEPEKEEKPAPEETEEPEKEEKPAPEETEKPEKEGTPAPEETEEPEKEEKPAPEETEEPGKEETSTSKDKEEQAQGKVSVQEEKGGEENE